MADERWEAKGEEVQVGEMEGRKKDYRDVGYGGFSRDYKPIPPEKVMRVIKWAPSEDEKKRYPLGWTEQDWRMVENHYVNQIERIMESWNDDTYIGWAVWMELTNLMILLLDELGLTRLCRHYFSTLFEPGYPRIESFRFNLFMPKSEQEEYEWYQDRKGEPYDRTVEFVGSEGEEEGGPEQGRHFWSPRPEAVDETG